MAPRRVVGRPGVAPGRLQSKVRGDEVGGGKVGRQGNLRETADPEQGLDVGFVGVCREGIDQKDEGGESSFDDTRADLLITTQGTGGNGFDLGQAPEPRGPAEDPTNDIRRVAGSHDSHAAERFGLSLQPALKLLFLRVVGHDRDLREQ